MVSIKQRLQAFLQPRVGEEVSFYDSPYYSKSQLAPYNPDDLYQKKGSLDIYEKMTHDDQIKAVMTMKKRQSAGVFLSCFVTK